MHYDCNAGHINELRSDVSFGALVSVPIAQRQGNIDFENGLVFDDEEEAA